MVSTRGKLTMAADLPPNMDLHEQLEAGTALQSPTFYETTVNYKSRVAQTVENFRENLKIEMSDEGDMTIVIINEEDASRGGSHNQKVENYLDVMSDQAYEQYRARHQSEISAINNSNNFINNLSETHIYSNDGKANYSPDISQFIQNKSAMEYIVDKTLNGKNSSHAISGFNFSDHKQTAKQEMLDSPERNIGWVNIDYEADQEIWKHNAYDHMTNDIQSLQVKGISIEGQTEYALNHEVAHVLAEKYSPYYITNEADESIADVLAVAYQAANGTLEQETIDRVIIQRSYPYIMGKDHGHYTVPALEKFLETTNLEDFKGMDRNEVTEKVLSESHQFMRTGTYINHAQNDPETGEKIGEMNLSYIKSPEFSEKSSGYMKAILSLKQEVFGIDDGTVSPKQIHYLLENNKELIEAENISPEILKPLKAIADRAYLITTAEDIELGLDKLEYEKPDTLHMNKDKETSLEEMTEIPTEMEATYPYDVTPEAQAEMTPEEIALASYNNEIVGKVWRDVETLEENNLTADERAFILKNEERHISAPTFETPENLTVETMLDVVATHKVALDYNLERDTPTLTASINFNHEHEYEHDR